MLYQLDNNLVFLIGQVIVGLLLLINGLYMWTLARNAEAITQKQNFLGTSLFLLICFLLSVGYVLDLYFRHYSDQMQDFFPEIVNIGGPGYVYIMLVLFAFACIPLMFPLEKHLIQSPKMWRTAIAIIAAILSVIPIISYLFISDIVIRTYLAYVALPFVLLSVILSVLGSLYLYLRLGFKSTGFLRTKALYIGFGFLVTYCAIALTFLFKGDDLFSNSIQPITLCLGLWLLLRGEKMTLNA